MANSRTCSGQLDRLCGTDMDELVEARYQRLMATVVTNSMNLPLLEALEEHAATLLKQVISMCLSGGRQPQLASCASGPNKRFTLPRVIAIHVNHGLHLDADREQHCRDVAHELDVEIKAGFEVGSMLNGGSARNARYDAFTLHVERRLLARTSSGRPSRNHNVQVDLRAIVTGRYSKSRALGAGEILRPLLGISRSEIEDYASAPR